jgi:hypothetical protein
MALGQSYLQQPVNYMAPVQSSVKSSLGNVAQFQTISDKGADRARQDDFRNAVNQTGGDVTKLSQLMFSHPDFAKEIQSFLGIQDDRQRAEMGRFSMGLDTLLTNGDTAGAQYFINHNKGLIEKLGSTPEQLLEVLKTNPEALQKRSRAYAMASYDSADDAMKYNLSKEDIALKRQQIENSFQLGQERNRISQSSSNARMGYQRDMLDLRRKQLEQAGGGDLMADINGNPLSSYKYNTQMLQTGVNPRTGKTATGAQLKAAKDWKAGDAAFTTAQMGLHRGLKQIQEIIPMLSEGVGPYTGRLPEMLLGDNGVRVRNLVASMQSGQFLANVKNLQGMGALSNAEGERVLNLIAKLDVTQGDDVVLQSLKDIETQYSKLIAANAQEAAAMGYSLEQLDAYLQDEAARDAEARAKAETEAKAEEKAKSEVEARKKAALSRIGDDELLGGL